MKKILFAALAALAITSCSQNEIDGIDNGTPKSKNEIGVNTIVKKSSRAAVTSNSSFTSFKLHAYNIVLIIFYLLCNIFLIFFNCAS